MQNTDIKIKGLFTNPNNLSEVPQGALSVADNVIIDRESIVESRRGQTFYNDEITDGTIQKLFVYRDKLIASTGNKLLFDANNTWNAYSGDYSPPEGHKISSVEANRNFYFTTTNGVYKLDTYNSGVVPKPAGSVKGLDGSATINPAESGSAVDPENQYAYRVVWGYRDRNNNLILGAPSQRFLITNEDPTFQKNVDLSFTIPFRVDDTWFYQVYRSGASGGVNIEPDDELQLVLEGVPSSTELTNREVEVTDMTPADLRGATLYTSPSQQGISSSNFAPPFAIDMTRYKNQVFYANTKSKGRVDVTLISVNSPSFGYIDLSSTVTTGSTTITVPSTENLRVGMKVIGTGIPVDTYIVSFIDSTTIEISNTGTSSGTYTLTYQDYIAIDDEKFWAGKTQDFATNTFEVVSSGSVGFNIAQTAINLVEVINKSTTNTDFYAYYQSGFDELPGQILIEEIVFSDRTFGITSSAGSSFNPILPSENTFTSTFGTTTTITSIDHNLITNDRIYISSSDQIPNGFYTVTVIDANTFTIDYETTSDSSGFWVLGIDSVLSDNDQKLNRIYVSKIQQPEAVPLLNYVDIGSADQAIIRIIALRDSVFIFKRDGVYRLSGNDPTNFYVELLDGTVTIRAPETAVAFNNQVFTFSDQGIVAVSDAGVAVMSRPIENTLLQVSSQQYTNFNDVSFALSYESNRQYIFFTVSKPTDTYPTQAYVYNSFTNTWTRWIMPRSCGIVNSADNKLYMGNPVNNYIYQERKDYTVYDFADESYQVNITNVDGDQITVDDATYMKKGMSLKQGDDYGIITSINGLVVTIQLRPSHRWEVGLAEVYTPIPNKIIWQPETINAPGMLKHFREITLIFMDASFNSARATFSTNFKPSTTFAPVLPKVYSSWGNFPWGSTPWGGVIGGQQAIRVMIPRESTRANWINMGIELNESFSSFSLGGVTLTINPMTERFK